jgi:hypothetical protein
MIVLSDEEIDAARDAASRRQGYARANQLKALLPEDRWDPADGHLLGALGEIAAAKYLGVLWNGATVGRLGGVADVGANIQVRTREGNRHGLIVRPSARDEDLYLLVHTLDRREFRIVGYLLARYAKEFEPSDPGGLGKPIHLVPEDCLLDPEPLRVWFSREQIRV